MEKTIDDQVTDMAAQKVEGLRETIDKAKTENVPEILQQIAELPTETEREIYKKLLSKKLGIGIRTLNKDLKACLPDDNKQELTLSANFPGLIDVTINNDNEVVYLMKTPFGEIETATVFEHDGTLYTPPPKDALPFKLPRTEKVLDLYEKDNDRQLFDDLMSYFQRFAYLPYDLWLIVSCKVALSYIQDHPDIHYLPEIMFYAVPERGKSRTGKSFIYVAYRGIHLIELREANLFRYSQDMKATLFFDIRDVWKKAERSGSEDILLMRYERGAKVSRVLNPDKGSFLDMTHYDIYGPTVIATNTTCHKILDTRCISITMPNKPGNYEDPTPEKAQELKDRLTAWRARIIDKPLPEIEPIDGISGRLWDISKPLFQVCTLAYSERLEVLTQAILDVSGQRKEDMKASSEGQIVQHLHSMSTEALEAGNVYEWEIRNADLLDAVNEGKPDEYKMSPQGLGKRLKAMGFKKRKVHGQAEILLTINEFSILLEQYGIKDTLPIEETLPNSTNEKNSENLDTYEVGSEVGNDLFNDHSLPEKSLEKQEDNDLVENGRESPKGIEPF